MWCTISYLLIYSYLGLPQGSQLNVIPYLFSNLSSQPLDALGLTP